VPLAPRPAYRCWQCHCASSAPCASLRVIFEASRLFVKWPWDYFFAISLHLCALRHNHPPMDPREEQEQWRAKGLLGPPVLDEEYAEYQDDQGQPRLRQAAFCSSTSSGRVPLVTPTPSRSCSARGLR
jgi:hypothetical protein